MKRTRFLALLMTLCLLTGLASAEGCAICGGDAVCDTCGGLGYLEMKTLSGEMAQVACFGGCVDGKCPDCAVACDVCGSDGLCDTCGGLGYLEMKAYGSDEMLQIACTGENCAAGKCAVCGAGAKVAAVEEVVADVPQGSYTFVEPAVEAAVRKVLGKETGDITYEELQTIKVLKLANNGLSSVEDLQYMTNLLNLNLEDNNISDITPLAGLINLAVLDLGDNNISDITPLAGLINLDSLYLWDNQITDIVPLAGLTNLTTLTLDNNMISDISVVQNMKKMEFLGLEGCNITNFQPLLSLTELYMLNISDAYVSNADIQKLLPQLHEGIWTETGYYSNKELIITPTPAPTATPSPYKAPIVGNDGLLVMSPEEYNDDIDDCDTIGQQDNYYTYRYINRGKVYDGDGDDAEWDNFEEYVDALADSGYYKVVANYDGESGNTEAWYLEYTGPGSVRRTFKVNSNHTEKAAIVVQSFRGDVYVFYSLDVITNDLEDTQYRLNNYINVVNPKPTSDGGGGGSSGHWETVEEEVDCPSCTFGNCSICGGDGKYERYGEVVSCDPDCGSCDGKGKIKQRKQVWVND